MAAFSFSARRLRVAVADRRQAVTAHQESLTCLVDGTLRRRLQSVVGHSLTKTRAPPSAQVARRRCNLVDRECVT